MYSSHGCARKKKKCSCVENTKCMLRCEGNVSTQNFRRLLRFKTSALYYFYKTNRDHILRSAQAHHTIVYCVHALLWNENRNSRQFLFPISRPPPWGDRIFCNKKQGTVVASFPRCIGERDFFFCQYSICACWYFSATLTRWIASFTMERIASLYSTVQGPILIIRAAARWSEPCAKIWSVV